MQYRVFRVKTHLLHYNTHVWESSIVYEISTSFDDKPGRDLFFLFALMCMIIIYKYLHSPNNITGLPLSENERIKSMFFFSYV